MVIGTPSTGGSVGCGQCCLSQRDLLWLNNVCSSAGVETPASATLSG
jgi:hypothetical protein